MPINQKQIAAMLSRRQLLSASAIIMAQSSPEAAAQSCPAALSPTTPHFAPDPSAAILPRKRIDELDFAEVTRLGTAYALLRAQPATARNAWLQQAEIHNCYCGGPIEEIHGSWFFYPWHRAYLYFHERILGKLLNDNTFRLPYWSWDGSALLPGGAKPNRLPVAYHNPTGSLNPLFDPLRSVNETMTMPSQVFDQGMITRSVDQTTISTAFLGSASSGASIEDAPHGRIHTWIGGRDPSTQKAKADMGLTSTAGRDPIFFAHHANIDRIWAKWISLGRRNHSDNSWLDKRWTFFDENLQLVFIEVRDVLDYQNNLKYHYGLPAAASTSAGTTTILSIPITSGRQAVGSQPATFSANVISTFAALVGARPELGLGVLLVIGGIVAPTLNQPIVNVFLNKPDATAATQAGDPAFVGGLVPFAGDAVPKAVSHDVTPLMNALPFGTTSISVTLVPTTSDGQVPPDAGVSFDNMELRIVKQE